MKILVIGDIHGCYAEMTELIEKAGLTGEDKIVALGDIVDRGPDSLSVIDFFSSHPNRYCVLGNHEAKHVKIASRDTRPSPAQIITKGKISAEKYSQIISFFSTLPAYIELPESLLIHAYLEPGIDLENQRKHILTGTLSADIFIKKTYPKPWYEYYNGEKPVIAGHHDYSGKGEPTVIHDKVYLIDTGCCYGRNLTGLVLPDFKLFSVKGRKNYWGLEMQQYKQQNRAT